MGQTFKNIFNHQIILLLLAILIAIVFYWPSMNGTPIFDDYHFIFNYNVVTKDFSYLTIFKDFAWPVSVSLERVLYQLVGPNYFLFHLVNVLLHALNAFLLWKLLDKLNLPMPRFIALLFLLHPANVLSVSWMVQLKTVLCFTFAILSSLSFLKALEDKKFYLPAIILFALSVLSKAASLPLALIFIVYAWKKKGFKEVLWTIPFLILATYSAYKVTRSEMTTVASEQIHSKTFVAEEKSGKVTPPAPAPAPAAPPQEVKKPAPVPTHNETTQKIFAKTNFILKTAYFYFWQILLPLESYPVKGLSHRLAGFTEYFHVIFVGILLNLNRGSLLMYALMGGYLFVAPFLGFTDAPYMTLTWVSDQHLYIALPFFLFFWMGLLAKVKVKYIQMIPALFLVFFSIQTYRATPYYQDDVTFYTMSLKADPYNLPIAYNLAVAYLRRNDLPQALNVTGTILEAAHSEKEISENKYFPYIEKLHGNMVRAGLKEP